MLLWMVLVKCNHDPTWIMDEDVSQLLGHLSNVLESMRATDPQDKLPQARFADEGKDEHCRMLRSTNVYGAPHKYCLHDLFLNTVQA